MYQAPEGKIQKNNLTHKWRVISESSGSGKLVPKGNMKL